MYVCVRVKSEDLCLMDEIQNVVVAAVVDDINNDERVGEDYLN